MITKLSHATIYVLDQEKAYDFYVNKLGLEVRTDAPMGPGFRWLTVGPKQQPEMEIVLYEAKPGMALDEESAGHIRALLEKGKLGGGVFNADDCQKTYEELSARGVTFLQPPQKQPYGVEALFTDDCGNWFSLTQH
jgi:catechol 2,3-dioxygenase-like lactoylglutathione lyase family enzyme